MKIFKHFFGKFFWSGLIIILISIIVDLVSPEIFVVNIIINLLSSVGVALMIGAVFDFSKNSQDFMSFVSSVLKEIIISKNFLKGVDDSEKKKALEMVLTPSGDQLEQCSDIKMYFSRKINETMEIFHTNFKTNLVVNVKVYKEDGIVKSFANLSYRVYKIEEKYFPLITTFEKENCTIEKSSIISPDGITEITENDVTNSEFKISPTNVKIYSYEIPEKLYKFPYLTIQKEVVEEGYDHWTNFHWNSLTPSDGITFKLTCSDDLQIKEYFIFNNEKLYNVKESDNKKEIDIISTVWLDKNSGFVFTISDTDN